MDESEGQRSVKSPLGLVLYCYLNMPTINKTYLILSYLKVHRRARAYNLFGPFV